MTKLPPNSTIPRSTRKVPVGTFRDISVESSCRYRSKPIQLEGLLTCYHLSLLLSPTRLRSFYHTLATPPPNLNAAKERQRCSQEAHDSIDFEKVV